MLEPLNFKAEITGNALNTLDQIQKMLNSFTDVKIAVNIDGLNDFKNFLKSDDFKNMADVITKAFGGKKAEKVSAFFQTIRDEIEKIKTAVKDDDFATFTSHISGVATAMKELDTAYSNFQKNLGAKAGTNPFSTMTKQVADVQAKVNQMKSSESGDGVDKTIRSIERAKFEAYKLDEILTKANNALTEGGGTNRALAEQMDKVKEIRRNLEQLMATGSLDRMVNGSVVKMSTTDYIQSGDSKIAVAELKRLTQEQVKENKKLAASNAEASASAKQLTDHEQKLAQAMQLTNQHGHNQGRMLNELKGMMAQYLSVYAASRFLNEMMQITGELELQQKSLEVIIDSSSKARELYADIRELSQQSPYTFQDLLKSERQLAAFGIQTKDLYGTMKALSDIGAGLSVDVQRLILAYGHTRSYGYLSGIQNRQFETAGIDLVGELAKYYNRQAAEIRKQGGNMQNTSRKEIFARMRKREISFEDVEQVILGLDQPGGKFYNMQIKQYETLGGKLRNLRNNYNIMMSEMGESSKGILMGLVNTLNELTGNWQKYANILKDILIPLGSVKLAMMAVNTAGLRQSKALAQNIIRTENMLALQSSGQMGFGAGWKAASGNIPYNKVSIREFKDTLAGKLETGEMTKVQLRQLALQKELGYHYRNAAAQLSGLNAAQASHIASLKGMNLMMEKTKFGLTSFGMGMRNFFRFIGSAIVGPQAIIMAVLAAITAAANHLRAVNQQSKQYGKMLGDSGANDQKSINDIIDTYSNGVMRRIREGSSFKDGKQIIKFRLEFDDEALRDSDLKGAIADMKEKLQALSPMYDKDLVDIDKMESQFEQFKAIMEKMESLRLANDVQDAYADAMAAANKYTGGLLNDDFITNLQDYEKSLRNSFDKIEKLTEKELDIIDKSMGGFLSRQKQINGYSDLKEPLKKYFLEVMRAYDAAAKEAGANTLGVVAGNGGENWISYYLNTNRNGWATANPDIASVLPAATTKPFYEAFDEFLDNGLFRRFLDEQRDEVWNDAPEFARKLIEIIDSEYGEDNNRSADFVALQLKNLKTQSGVTNADVIDELYESILSAMGTRGDYYRRVFDQARLIERFNKEIAGKVTSSTSDKEAEKILADAKDSVIEWAKSMSIDLAKAGAENGRIFRDAMAAAINEARPDYMWQERLFGQDGPLSMKFNSALINELKGVSEIHEAGDVISKAFKDQLETLEKAIPFANQLISEYFDEDLPEFKLSDEIKKDSDSLEKVLTNELDVLNDWSGKMGEIADTVRSVDESGGEDIASDRLERLDNAKTIIESLLETIRAAKQEGIDLSKILGQSYDNSTEKRWDERIRIMKEAYDWYDKWEKKVGDAAAIEKVNEGYGQIFEAWAKDKKLPFTFNANDIKSYIRYVEQIRDDAYAKYQKQMNDPAANNGQEAERVWRQAVNVLRDFNWDQFGKAAEDFSSIIEKTMDDMDRKWDIYSKVLEATGSRQVAMTMAGMNGSEQNAHNIAQALRDELTKQVGTNAGITYSTALSQKEILKMFQQAVPRGSDESAKVFREKIDGFTKLYERWQKATLDEYKNAVDTFTGLQKSLVDTQSIMKRALSEYNETMDDIAPFMYSHPDQYYRMAEVARLQYEEKVIKAQNAYQMLMDGAVTMSHDAALTIKDEYTDLLMRQLKAGTITAKQYADEIDNINQKMQELENTPSYFRSYIEGGLSGVFENMRNRGLSDTQLGAEKIEAAQDIIRQAELLMDEVEGTNDIAGKQRAADLYETGKDAEAAGQAMAAAGKGMSTAAGEGAQTVAIIDLIIHGINNIVQGLNDTYNRIKAMQVALGNRDEEEWTDTDTFLSSFSNASAAATKGWDSLKSGDIGGVIDGVVGSWTEWFKGYAEGHDKKIDYQIRLAERQLSQLSSIESRIEKIKEEGFGYDVKAEQSDIDKVKQSLEVWRKAREGVVDIEYDGQKKQSNLWQILGAIISPIYGKEIAGGIYDKAHTKETRYSSPYKDDTVAAMNLAVETESAYAMDYALLMMKRDELYEKLTGLQSQYKQNEEEILETENELWQVEHDLVKYTENFVKELSGLDLLDWADQIGNALMNAFYNGESAAQAFEDTVRSLLQTITSNVLKMAIIEPMIAKWKDELFGENGVTSYEKLVKDPIGELQKVTLKLKELAERDGEAITTALEEGYTSVNAGLGGFLTNPSTKTLSASIQGTTEQTSTLLAGYVNAARQDLAADRLMLEEFVSTLWPEYMNDYVKGLSQNVGLIQSDVRRIADAVAPEREDSLHSLISSMNEILSGIKDGTVTVTMA